MTPPYQWYLCPEAFDADYEELVKLLEESAREEATRARDDFAAMESVAA